MKNKSLNKNEKTIIVLFVLVFSIVFFTTATTGDNPLAYSSYLTKHQCEYPPNYFTQGLYLNYCHNFKKADGTWYSEEEEIQIRKETGFTINGA